VSSDSGGGKPYSPPRPLPLLHPTSPPPDGATGSPVDSKDGGGGELSGDFVRWSADLGGQPRGGWGCPASMCSGWRQVSPHGHGGAARREAGTAVRADATRAAACSQRRREVDAGGVQGGVWCVWPCEAAKGGAARAGWGGTASSLLQEGWPRGGCCGRARGGPAARSIGGGCGDMVEPKTRTRVGASPAASTPASAPPPGSRILPPPSRPPQPPSSFFVVSVFLTGKTAQAAMPFATSSLSHLPATRTHQVQYVHVCFAKL
ncbi:unnamed protein product, partial [Urochloa humidicola]